MPTRLEHHGLKRLMYVENLEALILAAEMSEKPSARYVGKRSSLPS